MLPAQETGLGAMYTGVKSTGSLRFLFGSQQHLTEVRLTSHFSNGILHLFFSKARIPILQTQFDCGWANSHILVIEVSAIKSLEARQAHVASFGTRVKNK